MLNSELSAHNSAHPYAEICALNTKSDGQPAKNGGVILR